MRVLFIVISFIFAGCAEGVFESPSQMRARPKGKADVILPDPEFQTVPRRFREGLMDASASYCEPGRCSIDLWVASANDPDLDLAWLMRQSNPPLTEDTTCIQLSAGEWRHGMHVMKIESMMDRLETHLQVKGRLAKEHTLCSDRQPFGQDGMEVTLITRHFDEVVTAVHLVEVVRGVSDL